MMLISQKMQAKDTIEYICDNIGKANTLISALLIGLCVNIITTIFKIYADFKLKNKEKSIHKANTIMTKSIEVQKNIYDKIYALTLFDASQSAQHLLEIESIRAELNKERIYFTKRLFKTSFSILDYFLTVATNYRNKDYKKENELLESYAKQFNS